MSIPKAGSATTVRSSVFDFGRHVLLAAMPLLLWAGLGAAPLHADAVTIRGKAILEHPAGKAMVEAGRLVKAGKVAEARKKSVKEVRDEWAAMSPAEQKEEAERLQGRTPDPATFEADIVRVGELVVDGDSARLSIPTASGDPSAMAFAGLENGKWLASRGPMTLEVPEAESAPAIRGAAILGHELGKLAVDYATKLNAGKLDAAMALVSSEIRSRLATLPAAERKASDDFRRQQFPRPDLFTAQIREGGQLAFYGEKAVLNVISSTTTKNPDGSVTSSSETIVVAFAKEKGRWVIAG
ncbi:MAG: hypothetical protein ABI639_16985 [Thermoanaerobaculia bacterium]